MNIDHFPSGVTNYRDVIESIGEIGNITEETGAVLAAVEAEVDGARRLDIIHALTRVARTNLSRIDAVSEQIGDFCQAADMARKAYDKLDDAIATLGDTEDGQALRNLARDFAGMIESIAKPAMIQITKLQNQAEKIDDIVQRARDLAGCLRWQHHSDRDPDLPEVGTVARAVGDTMAEARTQAFAAAIARAKARQIVENDAA
ncbi:MAG: hypothetical protein KJ585_04850 [Alphaproteobacteria bacterium]|nr:hypothetical protein [Alphaproteobacteria bacterium]